MVVNSKIILASNSPRRKELISLTGLVVFTAPADIDESPQTGEAPGFYVRRLANEKAIACKAEQPGMILAADTIVVDAGRLLGKPVDNKEARRMLQQLRGHAHRVMTAVTMFDPATGCSEQEMCVTAVPMRNYSDEEMDAYIATGDPLDKAGAYAIQHAGFHPVENFNGCFASVMGLPLCHIKRMAQNLGISVADTLTEDCQRINNYQCGIFQQVADGAEIG